jgi:ABC-type lipoprotein release transport system permease subunit
MRILKIAWRNILRHKGKSLVIGTIIFLGALIMTVGNASVIGAQKGFEENFVQRFSGDVILVSKEEKKDAVLFSMMGDSIKVMNNYIDLEKILKKQDYIDDYLPLTRGIAVLLGLEDTFFGVYAIGTNLGDYQRMYHNNVEITEGRALEDGERGILITEYTREQIYKFTGHWIVPEGFEVNPETLTDDARREFQAGTLHTEHDLVFIGWGEGTLNTDIRLPIKGIIHFAVLNGVLNEVSIMDIESFRECFGYFTAADTAVKLTKEEKTSLDMMSDDEIFGSADIFTDTVTDKAGYDVKSLQAQTEKKSGRVNLDEGAYNFISVRFKKDVPFDQGKKNLEEALAAGGADARIIDWKTASGQVAQMAGAMQGAVSIFVWLLFFVAAIIISNTLSMAALERTEELGMMRAIGALKGYFVSHMFILETFLLSAVFSALGIIAGSIGVLFLRLADIRAGANEMLHILFGGDSFKPVLGIAGTLGGILQLAILASFAMIYPIIVVTRIKPLDAINRN